MIRFLDKTTSTMDAAAIFAETGRLGVWDSVVARVQTDGRGQLRKNWSSASGNLFASIRLPLARPFNGNLGAIAAAALFLPPIETIAGDLLIKWPNDIVALRDGEIKKLAGILLEEKRGKLVAGIGVNFFQPGTEFDGLSLPPASLDALAPTRSLISPLNLWIKILAHIRSTKMDDVYFRDIFERKLLWKDREAEIIDGNNILRGVFRGINSEGGALMEKDGTIVAAFSGSMRGIGFNRRG